ncbi:MAG TPA: GGDEF domain-containing protein [Verrucomicrobiae bacterium]|nr:GGDEF domain-containing protein [Verrucomicrobiae bacterium]
MSEPHDRGPALPNFLPEDFLALIRGAVMLAWAGVAGMALVKVFIHLAGLPWPTLGGFSITYNMILAEFALTATCLSVLAIRREWFDKVPRAASKKLRTLLTLVVVWLAVHHFAAFHIFGAMNGPLLALLPLLIMLAFLCLPRSGAWAVTALLLGGHIAVSLLEYNRWIQSPGALAHYFAIDSAFGALLLVAVFGIAIALGWLARDRFDQAGANLNRGSRVNPLTGLYEQDFLMHRLGTELARQRRGGGNIALLLIEFDGFAAYTSAHGYDAGRAALRLAAGELIGNTRHDMDTPARFAPTTFALLLPDARREQAGAIATRIRESVVGATAGALRPRAAMACVSGAAAIEPSAVLAAAGRALQSAQADGVPAVVELSA